jgi:hypothetical protein
MSGDRAGRRLPRVVQVAELAAELHLREYELERLAVRAQLALSYSQACGLWIRREELSKWRAAASVYRTCRLEERGRLSASGQVL